MSDSTQNVLENQQLRSGNSSPLVSVIVPIRNEEGFIRKTLESILNQAYPRQRMEVLVVDGMSTDRTRQIVAEMMAADDRIVLLDNPGRLVARALNIGILSSAGEIIVRVDGHCCIPVDYVANCVKHLRDRAVHAVGGSVNTIGQGWTARGIALAMSTNFGVGGSAFRTTWGRDQIADSVPFPAYPRHVIERLGPYDEELVRNQDDEYNYRLRKVGGRILLAGDVCSDYYSRSTLRSFIRQYFQYGFWKVRVLQKHPRQMRWRQFVPPAFVGLLILLAALSTALPLAGFAFLALMAVYLAVNVTASLYYTLRTELRLFPVVSASFAILHLVWGAGFLWGLLRHMKGWKTPSLHSWSGHSGWNREARANPSN